MINFYETFGFESEISDMKSSFAIVGVWWLAFSQYSFYHLPSGNKGVKIPKNILWNGFAVVVVICIPDSTELSTGFHEPN